MQSNSPVDGSSFPSTSAFSEKPAPEAPTEDEDSGDIAPGQDEDVLEQDEIDTDRIASE